MEAFDADYAEYNKLVTESEALSGKTMSKARRRSSVVEPGENPYTLYTHAEIAGLLNEVMGLIPARESKLAEESARQESREALRKQWAEAAQAVVEWETGVSSRLQAFTNAGHETTLEEQVEQLKGIQSEIEQYVDLPDCLFNYIHSIRIHLCFHLSLIHAHTHTHSHSHTRTHMHTPTPSLGTTHQRFPRLMRSTRSLSKPSSSTTRTPRTRWRWCAASTSSSLRRR